MEFLGYQESDRRIKLFTFLTQSSSTSVTFPIETLAEPVKPVTTEKYEFKYCHKPTIKEPYGVFMLSLIWGKEKN